MVLKENFSPPVIRRLKQRDVLVGLNPQPGIESEDVSERGSG